MNRGTINPIDLTKCEKRFLHTYYIYMHILIGFIGYKLTYNLLDIIIIIVIAK